MSDTLGERLRALGYLDDASAHPSSPEDEEARHQMACAAQRRALLDRARPHWGGFLDTWASPMLRQAAANAPVAERRRVAQAWADSLPTDLTQALEELSGRSMADLLVPWLEMALRRRHDVSLPATALLEEWGAALDPNDPMEESDFWGHLHEQVRRQESQRDRQEAQSRVGPISQGLVRLAHAHIAQEKRGLGRIKVWRRRPAQWLEDLLSRTDFVRAASAVVIEHTRSWTGQFKGEQAFPALAVDLEKELTGRLGVSNPAEVDALERWLAQAIERALPLVLADPLATPQVARLVRESLHQDAHAHSLAPAPLLRPASVRGRAGQ